MAVEHYRAGRLGEAEDILLAVLNAAPASPDVLHLLGVIALRGERPGAAAGYLEKSIAAAPGSADLHNLLGSALARDGRPQAAIGAFTTAISLDPRLVDAHYNLGNALKGQDRLDDAVPHYRKAAALDPGFADAPYNMGIALRDLGHHDEAAAAFRKVLAITPDDAAAHNNLGTVLRRTAALAEAAAAFRRATEIKPDYAEAFGNLGSALTGLDRLDEARAACRRAVEIDPRSAKAHNNLGAVLQKAADPDAALAAYRHAIELDPGLAEAHNNVGAVLHEQENHAAAAAACQRAIAIRPDYARAHGNLASALLSLGRHEEALSACRRALELDPGHGDTHTSHGAVLQAVDRYDEARAAYDRAIEIDPDNASAYRNLGSFHHELGQWEEAVAALRRSLQIRPDFAEAYHILMGIRPHRPGDDDIRAMEDLLAGGRITDREATCLGFALAQAHEKLGNDDAAFAHLEKANRLKRATYDFAVSDVENMFERIIGVFDAALLDRARGRGCESGVPVFVLGMPRSGTTLVEQMLASHSRVHGAGELDDFRQIVTGLDEIAGSGRAFPEAAADLDADALCGLGESYVEGLRRRAPDAAHVSDKMPDNFRHVGLIHMALPKARIIHCRRDPVATCLSCFQLYFATGQPFAYDLAELGRYYRAYARLMDHWHAVLPGRILDVSYEDVVADQERETRRILDFCGLEWEDACLSFHATARPVRTASASQVRQPIYRDAVRRWRRYERHLGPLLDALGPLAPE